jgi:uncharacterized protein
VTATSTAVETVQALYAAFARGDIGYILERVTPDCAWIAPGAGIPNSGAYSGPQGVAQFFERLAASEEVTRFEPREFFSDESGNVVVLGSEGCRSKLTGKEMNTNWTMVFRIRGGKVAAWESYYDTLAYYTAHQK